MYYQFPHARATMAENEKAPKLRWPEASAVQWYSKALTPSFTIYIFPFDSGAYRLQEIREGLLVFQTGISVPFALQFDLAEQPAFAKE